jgi:diguanylate cyclase
MFQHVVNKRQKSKSAHPQGPKVSAAGDPALDPLTGIDDRNSFNCTVQRWVDACEKSGEPFTVALLDIDDFQQINNGYGNQIGDQILASAAADLARNIRSTDFLARFGGDEFIILSAGMRLAESGKRYSNLLRMIKAKSHTCKNRDSLSFSITFTASCGVAEYGPGDSVQDLIRRASDAVAQAKREGKNRVAGHMYQRLVTGNPKQDAKRTWCPLI